MNSLSLYSRILISNRLMYITFVDCTQFIYTASSLGNWLSSL